MGPGGPVTGQSVRVRYQQGGMMGGTREFHLYDDGTHGDEHAGDGMDHEGHHTNHVDVTVTLE